MIARQIQVERAADGRFTASYYNEDDTLLAMVSGCRSAAEAVGMLVVEYQVYFRLLFGGPHQLTQQEIRPYPVEGSGAEPYHAYRRPG